MKRQLDISPELRTGGKTVEEQKNIHRARPSQLKKAAREAKQVKGQALVPPLCPQHVEVGKRRKVPQRPRERNSQGSGKEVWG